MKRMKRALPDRPSELIDIALEDLEAVEKDPKYRVNMSAWHRPDPFSGDGMCVVCLAGAVMARRTAKGLPRDFSFKPSDYGPRNFVRLHALNDLRTGDVEDALGALGLEKPRGMRSWYSIPDYEVERPSKFKRAMRRLARRLEAAGL